jgi:lactoylglutathione lyase
MPDDAMSGARLLHTMLRVHDLDRALGFYVDRLGMRLLRRSDFPEGRFTLAFVGYDDESRGTVIELTHNWGDHDYVIGSAFGHIAIGVRDARAAVEALERAGTKVVRPVGPLKGDPREIIAFVEDPDGYRVELIELRS